MSELHLGLIISGALVVGAVFLYNKMQETRARKRTSRFAVPASTDALLRDVTERREPTLDANALDQDRPPIDAEPALPDERLDYIVELVAQSPISMPSVLDGLAHRFAGRVMVAGMDESGQWIVVHSGQTQRFERVRIALQLVKRSGQTTELDLIEFRLHAENLSTKLSAAMSAPDVRLALEAARNLDLLCIETDIQIALHVMAPSRAALDVARCEQALRTAGLELCRNHMWCARDTSGHPLFSAVMRNSSDASQPQELPGLTLLLDVPLASDVTRTYESMVRCGRQLAAALGGTLQDDNGRDLDDPALAVIEGTLRDVARTLEARGFTPGSTIARRLFS